ncbi:Acyl-CoA synthetase (AMP-forming)/AMP-acid ligase II [Mycobacterium rhizamassiliense]|uniref:Acyl-CoA synthetase (AMP-forming)/AMP-acid ligase II n=2 Tax=Mycobacterium TaxID=1763 RepID=A0A2U3PA28_9MYCO|nr:MULTISPECIES: AMP-binding protein [Mycobacterium]SPM34800.1 Acyl-CoA synthetase (AMP-forming)/AMP-acid ligase II [Mycobacterium rhizamassiliense]SPM40627.1 Acyl-CoA synthetase (AMP-forming)/AMP-acid ligase II [Mycobacterium numidiamassiliense]
MSYRRLDDESGARTSRCWTAPRDVVALLSDNAPEALVTCWATQRSGLCVTAINLHLTSREAAYIVHDSGARALIASAALHE